MSTDFNVTMMTSMTESDDQKSGAELHLLPAPLGSEPFALVDVLLLRGGFGGAPLDEAVVQHAPAAHPLLHFHHLQLHARPDLAMNSLT